MLRAVAARTALGTARMPDWTMVRAASRRAGIELVMRARKKVDELAPADGPVVRIRDRLGHYRPEAVVETHLRKSPSHNLPISLAASRVSVTGGER